MSRLGLSFKNIIVRQLNYVFKLMKQIILSTLAISFIFSSATSTSAKIPSKYNIQLTRKVLAENGQQNLSRAELTQFANTFEDIDTFTKTSNFDHLTEANQQDLVECSALLHSSEGTVLVDELKACYGFRTFKG